jgi:hypothetical protein
MEHLILLFAILVIGYFFLSIKENMDNSTDTIVGMENAYTNIHCLSPELPVIKLGNKSIACLTDNSGDESKCYKYSDFEVPNNFQCTNSRNSLNTYLSRDGLRNTSTRARQLFDTLMRNGYHNIECNKAAFDDPTHWCHKIKQSIDQRCNTKSEAERVTDRLCNKDLLSYSNASNPASNSKTIPIQFNPNSFQTRALRCRQVNCARQRGGNRTTCEANCNLCGNTTC